MDRFTINHLNSFEDQNLCFLPYHQTGHSYPAQAGTDVVPDPDAPTSYLLTHCKLQEEKRDADD